MPGTIELPAARATEYAPRMGTGPADDYYALLDIVLSDPVARAAYDRRRGMAARRERSPTA